jgi:hypothetical protein
MDLIERDAVLHDLSTECSNAHEAKYYEAQVALTRAKRIICDAPAVSRWIPCSERLPEDFVWCLVCMSDGCIRLGKWNGEYDEQGVWWVSHQNSGGKLYRIKNVPHWMPLPEPPEKE